MRHTGSCFVISIFVSTCTKGPVRVKEWGIYRGLPTFFQISEVPVLSRPFLPELFKKLNGDCLRRNVLGKARAKKGSFHMGHSLLATGIGRPSLYQTMPCWQDSS